MIPIILSVFCFISTVLGGMFALRYHDSSHRILAFAGGIVLGMVFLDLLPTAIKLSHNTELSLSLTCAGFMLYLILNSITSISFHQNECGNHSHKGILGASCLSLHSFMDGASIMIAFNVNMMLGFMVFAAVCAHDFSDGLLTTKFITLNSGSEKLAKSWLLIDAIAPFIGAGVFLFIHIPQAIEGYILAIMSGFFIFILTNILIPECHCSHPKMLNMFLTCAGILFIGIVTRMC